MKVLSCINAVVSKGRNKRNVIVTFYSDTKEEVNDLTGENIKNLTESDKLCLGSMAICADGSILMLGSDGQWNEWG